MKKLGGRTMKKLVLLVVVLLMAQLSYGLPSITYTCDFESGEQGTSFVTGALTGQGTPAWGQAYTNWEGSGSVINTDSYSGTQSMVVSGYQTSWINMGAQYIPKWIEFALKPQFDSTNDDLAWVMSIRGDVGDVFGLLMYLESATGDITVYDAEAGGSVSVGKYTNNAWQTISIKNNVVEYPEESGNMVYDGTFDVYVNGIKKGSSLGYTGAGWCIQTLVFSTTESTWAHGGTLGFDGINIGETPIYTIPEPATMGLLAMGLGFVIRRKRA
jgi:hypothetical protein